VPVALRDLETLPYVIRSVRSHVRHPIGRICVACVDERRARTTIAAEGCAFIPEDSILPFRREDIRYEAGGLDRSGWLFQQFLKLYLDRVSDQSHVLALDADTVLLKPQVFEIDGRTLLLHSDEHHQPYFDAYERLIGNPAPTPLSFVAHQALFSCRRLRELRDFLAARHAKTWFMAILDSIDRNEVSAFSEFETYGQWMMQRHPAEVFREYWFNTSLPRGRLAQIPSLEQQGVERSVSFHAHNP